MLIKFLVSLLIAMSVQLAWAAGKVESVVGSAQAIPLSGAAGPVSANQVVDSGTTITTGDGSRVVVRFDDGHVIALSEKSEFTIQSYRYDQAKPESGNVVFSLVKGALRSLTGLIGQRNRDNFAIRAPQATIGIRGTDFMVALVNPMYLSVISGSIAATNTAGVGVFAAGATATVASSTALAVGISAAALPAAVGATFSSLGAMPLAAGVGAGAGAGAGGASTGAAAGGAAGGIGAAGIAGIVAGVAAVGAIASDKEDSTTTTTAAHH